MNLSGFGIKEAPGSVVTNDTYPNSGGVTGVVTFELESGNGTSESRRIEIKPSKLSVSLDVELRRPSTIRSGNHTFEYVGFGPVTTLLHSQSDRLRFLLTIKLSIHSH